MGYGYCSYPSSTTTKQASCPTLCTYVGTVSTLSKMVPAGSTANKCDKDSGWACDYTVTTDNVCCGDPDCTGYGANHVKELCDCPTVGSCTYTEPDQKGDYTCKAPSTCRCNSDCDPGYCCTDNTPSCTTISPNTGKGLCEPVGTTELSKYLCASASPTSWHGCDASTVGQNYRNNHSSYMCLKENEGYTWIEITSLKTIMIILAVLFFMPFALKKIK